VACRLWWQAVNSYSIIKCTRVTLAAMAIILGKDSGILSPVLHTSRVVDSSHPSIVLPQCRRLICLFTCACILCYTTETIYFMIRWCWFRCLSVRWSRTHGITGYTAWCMTSTYTSMFTRYITRSRHRLAWSLNSPIQWKQLVS